MKLVRAVGALGLAGIAAVSAQAGAADEGYYLGAGIGQSWEKNHHDRITQQLRGSGFSTTSIDDDSRDTAWKLLGVAHALGDLGVVEPVATARAFAAIIEKSDRTSTYRLWDIVCLETWARAHA